MRWIWESVGGPVIVRYARRAVVAIVGGSLIVVGILMVVLPGPATLVIPAGLGVLAVEFAWASRLLKRVRQEGERALSKGWRSVLRELHLDWKKRGKAKKGKAESPDPDRRASSGSGS